LDELEDAHDMKKVSSNPIYSICSLKDGFVISGNNTITIYKYNNIGSMDLKNSSLFDINNKTVFSSNQYKVLKKINLTKDDNVVIKSIVKNSTEDELICYTSNNQLFYIDLYKYEENVMVNILY